ncbi:MAG: phosphotransferase [Actinomycetota bacterium]
MERPSIAWRPEDLTPEWLTGALRWSGALPADRRVEAASVSAVGTGQMGDSLRCWLTYNGPTDAPDSVVAKLPAADETSRATGVTMRSYEKEVGFYALLADRVGIRTPACHVAEIEVETGEFVLLLEDMAPARQGDQLAGTTPDVAAVVLDEAVKLHAPPVADPSMRSLDVLSGRDEHAYEFLAQMMTGLWPGWVDRYADRLDADVLEMGERFIADIRRYYAQEPLLETVVHGDFRLDNMLFNAADGADPVTVVDWQTVSVGDGLSDVAYFLGAGLDVEDRRSHERDLVHGYLDRLAAAGVTISGDDAWDRYRLYAFAGFHMAIVASMIVERTERGDDMFMAMASRHGRQVLDLDAESLLR